MGVSGGADSVALVRALAECAAERGLVLHVAHLHHGLRGEEADADLGFVRELAVKLAVPFHECMVDTRAEAAARPGKAAETIEEAARRLRYGWFRELMRHGVVDAVATAHTLDDQAETVLAKFLRGAWTEGLSGIHPVVQCEPGRIVRPLLGATRKEIESYLCGIGQDWREDSSNKHLTYMRNRIRHELLPSLESWNPKLREHLAQMADLAREENDWWDAETAQIAAQVILPGRPVRGGGRAAAEGIALDVQRLAELPVAVQRRVIRFTAGKLGAAPDFDGTEALRALALSGRASQRCELAQGLRGERSHRELRMSIAPAELAAGGAESAKELTIPIPGEADAEVFGVRVLIEGDSDGSATLRVWRPGDRVRLQYSSGPRKVKEVLERMHVTGSARASWPVLEYAGQIVWMQGVMVEPTPGIRVSVRSLDDLVSG